MKLRFSPRFWKQLDRLTEPEQEQVHRHLRLLAENLRHPSLQARRWSGSHVWYARVSRDIRIFFEVHEDYYWLVDVGHHDIERNY